MKCPICNNQSFVLKKGIMFSPPEHSAIWKKISRGYSILKCASCGLEFCDPMPSIQVLKTLYSQTYKNPRASKEIVEMNAEKNVNYLREKYNLNDKLRLVDYGCGDNFFVNYFKKQNEMLHWTGYDPFIMPETFLLTELDHDNDFLTMWGTLEHLVDPIRTLKHVKTMLKKKGKLVITTVFNPFTNIPYNHKPPEHTLYFTKKSIEILFKKTGFKLLEYSPYMMYQKPDIYLWCIFNSSRMEQKIRDKISIDVKKPILVPTNEVFIVGEKI